MRFEFADVQAVNVRDFTVDLLTKQTSTPLIGVPLLTPVNHPEHGGGINYMPEKGATCVVCFMDDDSFFVLGFLVGAVPIDPAVSEGPNYSGNRGPLEPGDIGLSTVDGNHVTVRRGGIVQIGSTGLAQRLYIPIGNVVRDYFQRYQALSPLGEIEWGHAQIVPDASFTSGSTPVMIRYNIRRTLQENVSNDPYTLELRYGVLNADTIDTAKDANHLFGNGNLLKQDSTYSSVPRNAEGTLSLTIYSHDQNPKKVVYAFQVGRNGDQLLITQGGVHVEVAQKVYVYAGDDVTVETATNKVIRLKVNGDGWVHLGNLGAGLERAVLGETNNDFLNAMIAVLLLHTHPHPMGATAPMLQIANLKQVQAQYVTSLALLSQHVKVSK